MRTVIKGVNTIAEYQIMQQKITSLANQAYQAHLLSTQDSWMEGEPVKAWLQDDCEVCVEYASGKVWCYKDLDLPFPSWWQEGQYEAISVQQLPFRVVDCSNNNTVACFDTKERASDYIDYMSTIEIDNEYRVEAAPKEQKRIR